MTFIRSQSVQKPVLKIKEVKSQKHSTEELDQSTRVDKRKSNAKIKVTSDFVEVPATPTDHSSFSKFHKLKKDTCRFIGQQQTHTSQLFGGIVAKDIERQASA